MLWDANNIRQPALGKRGHWKRFRREMRREQALMRDLFARIAQESARIYSMDHDDELALINSRRFGAAVLPEYASRFAKAWPLMPHEEYAGFIGMALWYVVASASHQHWEFRRPRRETLSAEGSGEADMERPADDESSDETVQGMIYRPRGTFGSNSNRPAQAATRH
jgi:hypothetical protein